MTALAYQLAGKVLNLGGGVISSGSGSGSSPSAPATLQVINQGGPNNGPSPGSYTFNGFSFGYSSGASANYQGLSWSPATPGTYSITKYNVYRNGSLYDSVATPIQITGYISGTTLTVTGVSGGTSTNGITDGKILGGLQLFSSATGFVAGTRVLTYTTAQTGGGGAGTYSVDNTQTSGSSGAHVIFFGWSFNDTAATGCNYPQYNSQATGIYTYTVTAVDSQGTEGAHAAMKFYMFQGVSFNEGYNYNYGAITQSITDTTGAPVNGPYDTLLNWTGGAGWLPVMGSNDQMNFAPVQRFEVGAFNYLIMDLKFSDTTYLTEQLDIIPHQRAYGSLAGSGDTYNNPIVNIIPYAQSTMAANTWITFKVPFSVLSFGTATFTGTFVANAQYSGVLTITGGYTGVAFDGSWYITGTGIPSGVYSVSQGTGTGGTGTYNVAGPNIVGTENTGSITIQGHGYSLYKIGVQWSGSPTTNVWVNNFGYSIT